jgi:hypothetical protein
MEYINESTKIIGISDDISISDLEKDIMIINGILKKNNLDGHVEFEIW